MDIDDLTIINSNNNTNYNTRIPSLISPTTSNPSIASNIIITPTNSNPASLTSKRSASLYSNSIHLTTNTLAVTNPNRSYPSPTYKGRYDPIPLNREIQLQTYKRSPSITSITPSTEIKFEYLGPSFLTRRYKNETSSSNSTTNNSTTSIADKIIVENINTSLPPKPLSSPLNDKVRNIILPSPEMSPKSPLLFSSAFSSPRNLRISIQNSRFNEFLTPTNISNISIINTPTNGIRTPLNTDISNNRNFVDSPMSSESMYLSRKTPVISESLRRSLLLPSWEDLSEQLHNKKNNKTNLSSETSSENDNKISINSSDDSGSILATPTAILSANNPFFGSSARTPVYSSRKTPVFTSRPCIVLPEQIPALYSKGEPTLHKFNLNDCLTRVIELSSAEQSQQRRNSDIGFLGNFSPPRASIDLISSKYLNNSFSPSRGSISTPVYRGRKSPDQSYRIGPQLSLPASAATKLYAPIESSPADSFRSFNRIMRSSSVSDFDTITPTSCMSNAQSPLFLAKSGDYTGRKTPSFNPRPATTLSSFIAPSSSITSRHFKEKRVSFSSADPSLVFRTLSADDYKSRMSPGVSLFHRGVELDNLDNVRFGKSNKKEENSL